MLFQLNVLCEELRDVAALFAAQFLVLQYPSYVGDTEGSAGDENKGRGSIRLRSLGQTCTQRWKHYGKSQIRGACVCE